MRIVIDMQGAQTESRFRGIGRYSLSFAQAIVRNRGEHEVVLALSGLFPDTIEPIRAAFDGLLPQENIRVWYSLGPVREVEPGNDWRRETAELIREAFLASLQPDVIHVPSLFEGFVDDAVTSIGRFDVTTPISVSLYEPSEQTTGGYVDTPLQPAWQAYYQRKQAYFKCAKAYLPANASPQQAIEQWSAMQLATDDRVEQLPNAPKPRLAFVSPLPPEHTGIADYSAELLPFLAKYYDIDVVVAQDRIDGPWACSYGKVRDIAWLRENALYIDRVIYHLGNSYFHHHMPALLAEIPGVVVLHDFYLSGLMAWLEAFGNEEHAWSKALYESHGYWAVRERFRDGELASWKYPVNWPILQPAHGVIVHSNYSCALAQRWYGRRVSDDWIEIPLLRIPAELPDKHDARKKLGFKEEDFVICSFGHLGPTKLNHRLLDCWFKAALAENRFCHLIFVGENDEGSKGVALLEAIRVSGYSDRIRITGFVTPETFRNYLLAANLAVQLRTQSRGETSAAILDCMNCALPVIVNANGAAAELDTKAVCMLPDEFDDATLVEALVTLWHDPEQRQALGAHAREVILTRHNPTECARHYFEAIEHFHSKAVTATSSLIHAIAGQRNFMPDEHELHLLSSAIAATLPLPQPAKSLFLDVSLVCRDDIKTGIQRVTRALTLALLESPPAGYRVEPVYLSDAGGVWRHRYARQYTSALLGCPADALVDDLVTPQSGDVVFLLDLSGSMLTGAAQSGLFRDYRSLGALCYAMVYDLLPVLMPEVFPPNAKDDHLEWLYTISGFDGAVCISKTVAEELDTWQRHSELTWKNRRPFSIRWFHLGADVANSAPSKGFPNYAGKKLQQFKSRLSFLMVGTIEPRKGYLQTLDAFTVLWNDGVDVNLVIVGKEGWKGWLSEETRRDILEVVDRISSHPELNKRLFWLEGISDEYLEQVYSASTCLIAASYGEGFGLPLIEAAQHKLLIIARDISVFREVAGGHAYYFQDKKEPMVIADTIKNWLDLYDSGEQPKPDCMPWLTWKQSAEMLCSQIMSLDLKHATAVSPAVSIPIEKGMNVNAD